MKTYLGYVTFYTTNQSGTVDNTIDISHLNIASADDYFVIITDTGTSANAYNGLRGNGYYIKSKTKDEFVVAVNASVNTAIPASYQVVYNPS